MNFKKLLCLMLCICFVFGAINSSGMLEAFAETEEELQQNIDDIEEEIAENEELLEQVSQTAEEQKEELEKLETQIDEYESKAADVQLQIHEINSEIDTLTAEYYELKREIEDKNRSIIKTNASIKKTEQEIADNKDLLAAKLRSAYMNGNESTLKILMGSDSLASFLTRLELMKRTSENDKKEIDNFKKNVVSLKKDKLQLEKDKAIIVENQKKVAETRSEYTQKKANLQSKQTEYKGMVTEIEQQYANVEEYVATLDKESAAYQSYIEELQLQRAAANDALDEFINNYIANNPPIDTDNNQDDGADDYDDSYSSGSAYYESSDDWVWPVGGISYYISAYYMDPTYLAEIGSVHYGIDITGGDFYGTGIYAARAGTVIASGDDGDGYGYKVIIDHGDGFISLYAHNSLNVVSTGESVAKGQLISYGGSTGYSTGPHLHYEIRYNGEKIDPANYHPGKV